MIRIPHSSTERRLVFAAAKLESGARLPFDRKGEPTCSPFGEALETTLPSDARADGSDRLDPLPAWLISLSALAIALGLYNLRALDDNRLTSWWWVFDGVSPRVFFLLLLGAVALAYVVSRLRLPTRATLPLLTGAAFLVTATLWQLPEVVVDASRHFAQAKQVELQGIFEFLAAWGHEIPAWTDLPLPPLLYGALLQVFGEHREATQAFTGLLFAGTAALTYLIGKALWTRELGLYAGAFLLAMPFLIVQTPLMMVDVQAMFFLTLAVYATIEAIARGGLQRCLLASLAIGLAMLTKYSNWLMLSVLPIVVLTHWQLGWRSVATRAAVVAGGALALIGVFLFAKLDVVTAQMELLREFQAPALGRWGESLLSSFFFQIHPFVSIAAAASIYLAVRRRDPRYLVIAWMLLVAMLLGLRRIRYMIVMMPMLALMAAYGLHAIQRIDLRRLIVANAVLISMVITGAAFSPFLQRASAMNLKHAGEYLDAIHAGDVEVHVLPQATSSVNPAVALPLLDLFTRQPLLDGTRPGSVPAPERVADLPWRWTWEVPGTGHLPAAGTDGAASTIVVIHSETDPRLPAHLARRIEGYRLEKAFADSSRVFRFKTLVRIYRRA